MVRGACEGGRLECLWLFAVEELLVLVACLHSCRLTASLLLF